MVVHTREMPAVDGAVAVHKRSTCLNAVRRGSLSTTTSCFRIALCVQAADWSGSIDMAFDAS